MTQDPYRPGISCNIASIITNHIDDFYNEENKNRKLDADIVGKINPNYGSSGTVQNCSKCASALELVRKGYAPDKFTSGRQKYPSTADSKSLWFKNATPVQVDTSDVETLIRSYGDTASGTLAMFYPDNSGGHDMHWTMDDGTLQIQDGQNGKIFDSVKNVIEEYNFDIDHRAVVYDLTNCEPNWSSIEEDSVLATRGMAGEERRSFHKFRREWEDYYD